MGPTLQISGERAKNQILTSIVEAVLEQASAQPHGELGLQEWLQEHWSELQAASTEGQYTVSTLSVHCQYTVSTLR